MKKRSSLTAHVHQMCCRDHNLLIFLSSGQPSKVSQVFDMSRKELGSFKSSHRLSKTCTALAISSTSVQRLFVKFHSNEVIRTSACCQSLKQRSQNHSIFHNENNVVLYSISSNVDQGNKLLFLISFRKSFLMFSTNDATSSLSFSMRLSSNTS